MRKVAFIGTGGTISSIGRDSLDITDYGANKTMLTADAVVEAVPELAQVAEVIPVVYRQVGSPQIYFNEWKELVKLCDKLVAETPDLAGIVIGHGTATLEESAYFLGLTVKVSIPVVIVGSQRPLSGLSTDARLNLVNAVRVAADPQSIGRGVLVVLNDEIHPAREVTKTSTFRLQTFRAPDFGMLGYVDGPRVQYYRRTERRIAPDTEFDIRGLAALPRVDIAYAYAGADGTEIRAFHAAGAKGIVDAGFAPGMTTDAQVTALSEALAAGVAIVQATRAGSGVTLDGFRMAELGFVPSDNLNPQKARILLALALTGAGTPEDIRRIFATY
jgi:L-asparaginase